jgi:hypothetical protein
MWSRGELLAMARVGTFSGQYVIPDINVEYLL